VGRTVDRCPCSAGRRLFPISYRRGAQAPIASPVKLPSPPRSGSQPRAPIAPCLGVRLPSLGSHRRRSQALGCGLPLPLIWGCDSHRSALIGRGSRLSASGSHCPLSGRPTPIGRRHRSNRAGALIDCLLIIICSFLQLILSMAELFVLPSR